MQIEGQARQYEVKEETVERALALVKTDGFEKELNEDNTEVYTAEITYPIDREPLLARWDRWKDTARGFGFHYTPYNFDSQPEMSFFEALLRELNLKPADIDDILFTGALTDPKKTDFFVEYRGEDSNWHRYTPDFIIRKKNGKCLIVEIKDARFKATTDEDIQRYSQGMGAISIEGRKAVALKQYEQLNPDRLQYEILYTRNEGLSSDQISSAMKSVEEL